MESKPSFLLAIVTYAGAAWLASKIAGLGAWPLGILAAFLARGASSMPLFRDQDSPIDATDDSIAARITRRLESPVYSFLRKIGGGVGQGLGTLFVLLIALGIVAQLPGSCAREGPDYEPEYRAR